MEVIWLGQASFGAWVASASGLPSETLVQWDQTIQKHDSVLIVEGTQTVPPEWRDGQVVRIVDQSIFSSLSRVDGPLGVLMLREEAEAGRLADYLERVSSRQATPGGESQLAQLINGPIAHDVRGAVGVIQLVTQVLAQSKEGSALSKRLSAAAFKIQSLLQELEVVVPLDLGIPLPEQEAGTFQQVISELEKWIQSVHRTRTVELTGVETVEPQRAPPHTLFVLRSLLDAALRLTSSDVPVTLSFERLDEGCLIKAETSVTDDDQDLANFLRQPLSSADIPKSRQFLFRPKMAALLVERWGGQLHCELSAERLTFQATLNAVSPARQK